MLLACIAAALAASPAAASAQDAPAPIAPPAVTVALPPMEALHGPNIFGTVALPVHAKPTSTRWAKLMFASLDQPGLAHLVEEARNLAPQQQAAFVQSAVSRWVRISSDGENCTDTGVWPSGEETLTRGVGNCFSVAIAKMEALRLLGISTEDLFLTTGYAHGAPGERGRESVALLVRIDGDYWLLPEQEGIVEAGVQIPSGRFDPVLTYGVGATWVHGRIMKVAALSR